MPHLQSRLDSAGYQFFDRRKPISDQLAFVGFAACPKEPPIKNFVRNPLLVKVDQFDPEVAKYDMPTTGSKNEKLFLKNSDSRKQRREHNHFDGAAEKLFVAHPMRASALFDGIAVPYRVFIALSHTVNDDAVPGFPRSNERPNKEAVIEHDLLDSYQVVNERLLLYHIVGERWISQLAPEELVSSGLADPYRVVVKKEGIKGEKLAEDRGRVIEAASFDDEMLAKSLLYTVTARVLAKPGEEFSLLGLPLSGPKPQEFLSRIAELQATGKLSSTDGDGFEYSHNRAVFLECAEWCRLVLNIPTAHPLSHAIRCYALCLSAGLFVFRDGALWAQTVHGMMKSGVFVTSLFNTLIMVFIMHIAGPGFAVASSDDCVAERRPGAEAIFQLLGYKIKGYQDSTIESFECCSHLWAQGFEPYPMRFAKATFNYVSQPITPQTTYSYVEKFHKVIDFNETLAFIASCVREQETNE